MSSTPVIVLAHSYHSKQKLCMHHNLATAFCACCTSQGLCAHSACARLSRVSKECKCVAGSVVTWLLPARYVSSAGTSSFQQHWAFLFCLGIPLLLVACLGTPLMPVWLLKHGRPHAIAVVCVLLCCCMLCRQQHIAVTRGVH